VFDAARPRVSMASAQASWVFGAFPASTGGEGAALAAAGFVAGAASIQPVMNAALAALKVKPGPARASARVLATVAAGALFAAAVSSLASWSPVAAVGALAAASVAALMGTGFASDLAARLPRRPSKQLFETARFDDRAAIRVRADQLGKPYLLSATLERGLGEKDFPSTRSLDMEFVWYFRRSGDHLELVRKNTAFRAPAGTAIARTLERSIPDTVVARALIRSDFGGRLLVPLDELFGGDLFDDRSQLGAAYGGQYRQDGDATRVEVEKSFLKNLEVGAELQYERVDEGAKPESHLPDTRRLTLATRYSLSELPEPGFRPRQASPVVGHFVDTHDDWGDDQKRDLRSHVVRRWRLEKTDPAAPVSPVKQPIVYWIDGSVPPQYRGAIRRGVLEWNKAFERVGLKDAIVVREAPDDGSFDPADARFNVIRYYLERDSGYAIGPSRSNPMTGEIYNAGVNISAYHARHALGLNAKSIDHVLFHADGDDDRPAQKARHAHGPREVPSSRSDDPRHRRVRPEARLRRG
jgi:hypothetical protein